MTIKTDINLNDAFSGKTARREAETAEVPERIRRDAPTPVLRPDGSWKARADQVDSRVREQQDARRARNEWAARQEQARPARTLRTSFKRSMT